ncbi:hypothetical protein B0H16DRAFT_1466401 [Mycena metata]|uniref:Uncharacterized protein n=1 Tax=Mycena metata TaxID=1033252 RepID=A0AAD7I8G6_9AGAR|nr:hypothetical protein B0H16DRAFT_1466401 [Mycena metata]
MFPTPSRTEAHDVVGGEDSLHWRALTGDTKRTPPTPPHTSSASAKDGFSPGHCVPAAVMKGRDTGGGWAEGEERDGPPVLSLVVHGVKRPVRLATAVCTPLMLLDGSICTSRSHRRGNSSTEPRTERGSRGKSKSRGVAIHKWKCKAAKNKAEAEQDEGHDSQQMAQMVGEGTHSCGIDYNGRVAATVVSQGYWQVPRRSVRAAAFSPRRSVRATSPSLRMNVGPTCSTGEAAASTSESNNLRRIQNSLQALRRRSMQPCCHWDFRIRIAI